MRQLQRLRWKLHNAWWAFKRPLISDFVNVTISLGHGFRYDEKYAFVSGKMECQDPVRWFKAKTGDELRKHLYFDLTKVPYE